MVEIKTERELTIKQNNTFENKIVEALIGRVFCLSKFNPSLVRFVEQNVFVKTLNISVINKANGNAIFKPIILKISDSNKA